jgi:predicted ABC-type ATPase
MDKNATFYDNHNNAESVDMSNGMSLQDAYNVVANSGLKATKIEINNNEISTLNTKNPEEMTTETTFGKIKSPDSLSILRKHRISTEELSKLLQVGMEHEMEHTTDVSVAMAIAKAHIYENKDYYKKLQELKLRKGAILEHEREYKRGGSIEHPKINWTEYYKRGGKLSMPPKDENGVRKIDADSIERLTEYVNSLPQTKFYYFDTDTNDYRKDRKKLHTSIINEFKKDVVCITKGQPIAILMGGSPASGKSSFLKKYSPYLLKSEILKVDADEIRAKLPEYEGWNATQTHLETKDIVNTLISDRNIGIPCDFDLIYDGTMNNVKSYKPLIKILRDRGYKIFIVYMDNVPKDVIEDRILKRYQKAGRFVPLEVVDDFFSKGKSAFNELKDEVDGYLVIDGSSTDYNIIDQGGIKLPQTRRYSKLGQKITEGDLPEEYAKGGQMDSIEEKYNNITFDF